MRLDVHPYLQNLFLILIKLQLMLLLPIINLQYNNKNKIMLKQVQQQHLTGLPLAMQIIRRISIAQQQRRLNQRLNQHLLLLQNQHLLHKLTHLVLHHKPIFQAVQLKQLPQRKLPNQLQLRPPAMQLKVALVKTLTWLLVILKSRMN